LTRFRAYRQEQGQQHIIVTASAETILDARSLLVWWCYGWNTTGPPAYRTQPAENCSLNGLSMASGLRTHLHRCHLHDNRLRMPGKQTQVQRRQYCRRHRKHADIGVHVKLQGEHSAMKMMMQISVYSKSLVMRHHKFCFGVIWPQMMKKICVYIRPGVEMKRHNLSSLGETWTQACARINCRHILKSMIRDYVQYIQTCTARSHNRYIKQTQAVHHVATLLAHDIKRRAHRHHLFEKVFRVAGRLGSAGPQVFPSVKAWRHQPNTLLSVCHDMHKMSSGLASCRRCNAFGYTLHMIRMALSTCCLLAQAA